MEYLVVFYSRTGNTKKIAKTIAQELNADIEEIQDIQNRKGPIGFIKSGREAMSEKLTQIKNTKDPSKYKTVIIGTPVWASNISSPVRTYIHNNKTKFKKVAFFCTTGGTGTNKIFKKMRDSCNKKPIDSLAITSKDFKENYKVKINKFIRNLK